MLLQLLVFFLSIWSTCGQYTPDWPSLDTRPLPEWYDKAKFGIFLHWGVFSVPGFKSEWFWNDWKTKRQPDVIQFMEDNYPPDFTYQDFAEQFQIEFFDPDQWADLFMASGAKYVVLTSKHHEGYTLWPSKYSWNWNAMDVGPAMDLVGSLANSIRNRTDLHFGVYHSLYEWYNPIYLEDRRNLFINKTFPQYKTIPELYELVNNYKPDIIWSDGDWEVIDLYWGSTDFLAWLYNESPVKDTVVTNDRWGIGVHCRHGDFYTCTDEYNPGVLQPHKWENCLKVDTVSWGYRRNAQLSDFLDTKDILYSLASTISCGGNLLLNVGPSAEGRIIPIFEERLRQIGQWLSINGEAVYDSNPWSYQNDTVTPGIWYTMNEQSGSVYAFVFDWPESFSLSLGAPSTSVNTIVNFLGIPDVNLDWTPTGPQGLTITLPQLAPSTPLQWAWVLKFVNLS
ncbi:hypothetical protein CHUAL_003113 [Chamberlinius hualienensis]